MLLISCGKPNQAEKVSAPPEDENNKTTKHGEGLENSKDQFHISEVKKSASLSDILVIPQGFEFTKDTFRINDSDPLMHTFLLDLDQNGFQEVYIITSSAGSGSYATIYGYASNKDKSATPIYVRPLSEDDLKTDDSLFKGYRGHDSIYVSEKQLLRKFPVYLEDDANCCPSGGHRTLTYQLVKGEASWQLEWTLAGE